jgi:hypothetical protein
MSTKGVDNWNKNWKGSDKQSKVKKSSSSYYKKSNTGSFIKVGSLSEGTLVTYIDSQTKDHKRSAIKLQNNNDDTYYINIDNLVKPITNSRAGINLTPSSLGLDGQNFFSVLSYYNSIIESLNSRNDIDGELFDYLFELLDYSKNGTSDFTDIKMEGFPWGKLISQYGEVLGPIICAKNRGGIMNGLIPTMGLSAAKIYIPSFSEPLYDYKLICGKNEYLISAKSARAVSNQVKPQYVVPVVRENLSQSLLGSDAFKLLNILADKNVKQGPFYAWKLLQNSMELTNGAIGDMETNYAPRNKKSTDIIVDYESWKPFLKKYFSGRKKVTYGELRYKCEQLIESNSKVGNLNINLKEIFKVFLNESRVIYVKTNINSKTGKPSFTASAGGGSKLVRRLYLRSSNSSPKRLGDKMGFQVS